MKILMVTPYLPYPPASGGQIRTLNLLKYLSRSHDITLISLYKKEGEKGYASYLKSFCNQIYLCKRPERPWHLSILAKAIISPQPLLIVRNYSNEAKELLEKLLKNNRFDVIHAETFYVMPHLPQTDIPILLVEQTIEYKVYQHFVDKLPFILRPFFNLDIFKLKHWERYYWKKASMVATVSTADEKLIRELEPTISPVVIPNGAGDEMFVKILPSKKTMNPVLLFIGNFFWLQNKEAANFLIKEIAPRLQKELPHCKIIIAGQEAKRISPSKLVNVDIIDIKPDDNEKVKSLYQKATLFIAPIYGPGGTRLKILAAMASGLPVISTKTGVKGLGVQEQEHVLIAESADEFIAKIKNVLFDHELYKKLQKNSYIKAKSTYNWSAISKKLAIVYKSIRKSS